MHDSASAVRCTQCMLCVSQGECEYSWNQQLFVGSSMMCVQVTFHRGYGLIRNAWILFLLFLTCDSGVHVFVLTNTNVLHARSINDFNVNRACHLLISALSYVKCRQQSISMQMQAIINSHRNRFIGSVIVFPFFCLPSSSSDFLFMIKIEIIFTITLAICEHIARAHHSNLSNHIVSIFFSLSDFLLIKREISATCSLVHS